jgi:hypothetical protein
MRRRQWRRRRSDARERTEDHRADEAGDARVAVSLGRGQLPHGLKSRTCTPPDRIRVAQQVGDGRVELGGGEQGEVGGTRIVRGEKGLEALEVGVEATGAFGQEVPTGILDARLEQDLRLGRPPGVERLATDAGTLGDSLHRHRLVADLDEEIVDERGRIVGLFSTVSSGFRTGSGIILAALGAVAGIRGSLALSALILTVGALVVGVWTWWDYRRREAAAGVTAA